MESGKHPEAYPENIAKVIQIVDLDGTYLLSGYIHEFAKERQDRTKLYYDGANGFIECGDIYKTKGRNERKSRNLEYLYSLTEKGISLGKRTIPYEIYFFSSNLDHFLHNDANLDNRTKTIKAKEFNRLYANENDFCDFFLNDPDSVGEHGYVESWELVKQGDNSVRRHTNLDYLIKKILGRELLD